MGIENEYGSKIPEVEFSKAQQPPDTVLPSGFNIGALITETILVFIQGLFMGDNLPHKFSYYENDIPQDKRIKIMDAAGFPNLNVGTDPAIVVRRGTVSALGRGGLNRHLSVSMVDTKLSKIDLISCGISVRIYGDYSSVELYSSLIFMAFTFLTEPLKKFTIYSVGNPSMSEIVAVKRDSKIATWVCTVGFQILKEIVAEIDRRHFPKLRNMVFKASQVFDPNSNKAIITLS